ncbi:MAG: glycosyltransferase family 9 protein [Bacteroidia bacterium]|nr:glycosyltransferase family 9 protein [Bacteroidia bacterium]
MRLRPGIRPRILLIRFSSIGDIVLTTPVIRSLREAHPDWELHMLVKPGMEAALGANPRLDRIHRWRGAETLRELKRLDFSHILDLQHNLRSLRVRLALGAPASVFPKYNLEKYLLVRFKRSLRPIPHVVFRYAETLRPLGAALDAGGLEFFVPPEAEAEADAQFRAWGLDRQGPVLAVVLGATYRTKRWPPAHFAELIRLRGGPVLLLGGPDARADADAILAQAPAADGVGQFSLAVSAALMRRCSAVLTHDTGMMHIAAAFGMQIYSLWGSTVPAFGMTPFRTGHAVLENQGLGCRPCSKLGHDACPLGHFRCMEDLRPQDVLLRMRES